MNRTTASPRSLLPAFLIMLVVFFLIFMTLRTLYPPQPLSRPTSTPRPATATITRTPEVSKTYTVTPTITRTPRPTWTQQPTTTRTATPTSLPTDTPQLPIMPTWVKPAPYNDLYLLRPWSPEEADNVIQLLQAYPDTLYPMPEDRETTSYNAAFTYVIYAQKEALLRYPNDPRAEQWRWGLVTNLTHVNDPSVSQVYADLIQKELDQNNVPIDKLPEWFNQHEPDMSLFLHRLNPQPGYLSRQLIEITAPGGSAYLWLVESPGKVDLFPLTSYFDYANAIHMHFSVGDLTGDRIEEIVLYADPAHGQTMPALPVVFSLENNRTTQLSFSTEKPVELATEYQIQWMIEENILRSKITIFPICSVHLNQPYQWDGTQLKAGAIEYQIEETPAHLSYCEGVIDHVASQLGAKAVIPMVEKLFPLWPPLSDPDGKPYPADVKDAWRYRLGVYHALTGNFEDAQDILSNITTHPTATDSRWINPALQFIDAYPTPNELYSACLSAEYCDPRQAILQLIESTKFEDISMALEALIRWGVIIRSSGNFDFDNDGIAEKWLLLRHRPQERLEFWVLARWEQGVKALFVEQVDATQIIPYFHEPLDTPPIVQIRPRQGFVLTHLSTTLEPYLTFHKVEFIPTTFTRDHLDSIIEDLFAGISPTPIRDQLLELEKSDRFNCSSYNICDLFYYTLGLAHELAGDVRPAIDTYVKLWWENSHSPYMLIARLKLKQLPYKSLTPTISPTPTASATHTPKPNDTQTPTLTTTSTRTDTPTPTEILTPTP